MVTGGRGAKAVAHANEIVSHLESLPSRGWQRRVGGHYPHVAPNFYPAWDAMLRIGMIINYSRSCNGRPGRHPFP